VDNTSWIEHFRSAWFFMCGAATGSEGAFFMAQTRQFADVAVVVMTLPPVAGLPAIFPVEVLRNVRCLAMVVRCLFCCDAVGLKEHAGFPGGNPACI